MKTPCSFLPALVAMTAVFHANPGHAQVGTVQTVEWARNMSGPAEEYAKAVVADENGNVYSAGAFQQTSDFNPITGGFNLTSAGGYDAFVQKHNANGDLQWAFRLGNGDEDRANSIALDEFNNVVVTGWFSGSVDFDPGPGQFILTSSGNLDIFMCKYDSNGEFIWAKSMGGPGADKGNKVLTGAGGDIWLLGEYSATADFDPADSLFFDLTSAGSLDAFVCRYNSNGHLIWAKSMGGPSSESAMNGALDAQENIIIAGYFQQTADFDPSPGGINELISFGSTDGFAVKLNAAGEFLWAGQIGGASLDLAEAVAIGADGSVYLGGYFYSTADFDPLGDEFLLTTEGESDAFVCKWDSSGAFQWAVAFGGTNQQRVQSLMFDTEGNLCVMGIFQDTVDFDPGPGDVEINAQGGFDTFLLHLDTDANLLWIETISNPFSVLGLTFFADVAGNYYVSGSYSTGLDLDTQNGAVSLPWSGGFDALLVKYSPFTSGCNTASTLDVEVCNGFQAPSGAVFGTSGTYLDIIPNQAGCDSLITINLTILQSTFTTLNETTCDFFELNGIEYFESGSYEQILPNAAGCDSIITLNLSVNPLLTSGHLSLLTTAAGTPVADMAIELFDINQSSIPMLVSDSDDNGMALLQDIPYGDYYCRAKPNGSITGQENMLTTYTNEQFHWTEANILTIGCYETLSETIELIMLPTSSGNGVASGAVLYASVQSGMAPEPEIASFQLNDPIPGVPVIIGTDSIGSPDFAPVALSLTDDNGAYSFANLPDGFYSILVDYLGTPQAETHFITISEENQSFADLNFYVDESVGVYISDNTAISEFAPNAPDFLIYPNPFGSLLTIHSADLAGQSARAVVRSADGRLVADFPVEMLPTTIDLSPLASGVYLLEIRTETEIHAARVVKW